MPSQSGQLRNTVLQIRMGRAIAGSSPFLLELKLLVKYVLLRTGGRVVDCTGLENRRAERLREFESHPVRSMRSWCNW